MRILTAVSALAVLGLVAAAGEARAVVIVIGGGAGAACYSTAEFGDPFQAFDICSKALTDQEMSVRDRGATYINRSVVRLRVHDYNGAIADCDLALVDLNKAITLGLDKVHLDYYNRGLAKEKLNDVRGAYADYKK